MDAARRIKIISIIEKVQKNTSYAQKIGIKDTSRFSPIHKMQSEKGEKKNEAYSC